MRISRQQMFMEMAHVAAKRSTCFRLNVGAVVVKDNRNVVGIGYNGAPAYAPHCRGNMCEGRYGCNETIHAEVNALGEVPKDTQGKLDLYVTDSPCHSCARFIIKQGQVRRVFFDRPYRLVDGLNELVTNSIGVYRCTAAGYVIDWRSEEIVEFTSGGARVVS